MTSIAKLTERYTESVIDGEVVIMRLDNGDTFSLTGTAATAWKLIDGNRDRPALLAALAGQFPAEQERMEADVDDFLLRLREMGLLAGG